MDKLHESLPPVQSFPQSDDGDQSKQPFWKIDPQLGSALAIPKGPPDHWNSDEMIQRVKVGVRVELSTIPLYLYAMYSVSGGHARGELRGILQQEMLHLALAGNILSALGGSLDLYHPSIVPQYPDKILMDEIEMELRPFDAESLDHFIHIESPSPPQPQIFMALFSTDIGIQTHNYKSIGDLYESVKKGIGKLTDQDFANNPDCQFTSDDPLGDGISLITNKKTAVDAMDLIIEQGEGNTDSEESHYQIFTALKAKLQSDPSAWGVRPVPKSPQTANYDSGSYIHKLSLAFDAAYCYLLQTIQRVWLKNENGVRKVLIENINTIMTYVLTPLAEKLVQQPWGNGVAAPCFNYYPMTVKDPVDKEDPLEPGDPLAPEELHTQLGKRMQDAVDAAPEAQKSALEKIKRAVDESKPSVIV